MRLFARLARGQIIAVPVLVVALITPVLPRETDALRNGLDLGRDRQENLPTPHPVVDTANHTLAALCANRAPAAVDQGKPVTLSLLISRLAIHCSVEKRCTTGARSIVTPFLDHAASLSPPLRRLRSASLRATRQGLHTFSPRRR